MQITFERIKTEIINKIIEIGYVASDYVYDSLKKAATIESHELAIDVLSTLCKNLDIAKERNFPLCQDTGIVVFWVKIGHKFPLNLFKLDINRVSNFIYFDDLCNSAVKEAFSSVNFRHSIVKDPIERVNTKDNTPAIVHYEFVDGENLEIRIILKGAGSENMSAIKMLNPADGITGIRTFVLDVVKNSGGNACPPLTVGIGIGGNFETCALLAKKSLFRTHSEKNPDPFWAKEEEYLLKEINTTGIGALGLGGITTALNVFIETKPCHIASLPVAVNLECHAHRLGILVF